MSLRPPIPGALERLFALVLVGILLGAVTARGAVRTLESDSRHVVLEIRPEAASVAPVEAGGRRYVSIRIPDMGVTDRSGEPELPVSAVRVAVPPGTTPRLTVRDARWSARQTGAVRPSPDLIAHSDPFGPDQVLERETPEDARYRSAATFPEQAFTLSDVMGMRDLRVVDVRYHGAQAETFGRSYRLLESATLEITFDAAEGRARSAAGRPVVPDELWNRTYRSAVANRGQAATWARGGPGDAAAVGDTPWGGGPQCRVEINRTGLLEIRFADLSAAGFPSGVPVAEVSVYQRTFRVDLIDDGGTAAGDLFEELPVPVVLRDRNTNGVFDASDGLLLWGRAVRDQWMTSGWEHEDKYDTRNFVFVRQDPSGGARMAVRAGAVPSAGADSLVCTPSEVFREEDRRYTKYPADFGPGRNGFESEFYCWNDHRTPTSGDIGWTMSDPFTVTDLVADSSATLVTRVCPTGRPLFHTFTNILDISVNATSVFTRQFYNYNLYTPQDVVDPAQVLNTAVVAPGILQEGSNSFDFRGRSYQGSGTTTPFAVARFLLDWYRVTYPRALVARGDVLHLDTSKGSAGPQRIRVRGFTGSNVLLFDITAPGAPVFVSLDPAQVVADGGGGFDLRFAHDNGGGTGAYVAIRESAIAGPTAVTPVPPPTILAGGIGSRWAAVAHDDLASSAQAFADYRSTRYPGAVAALLSQIYDVFGNGRIHPDAIRDYSAYAYHRWSTPLEFLCLIGDASEDHRGVSADSDPDLLPSHSLWAVYEGTAEETDQFFAEVTRSGSGFDELSDLYVGRLAVNTNEEMNWNLARMEEYENEGLDELWRRKTLLLADDALSGDLGAGVGSGYGWHENELEFCGFSRSIADTLADHPVDALLPDVLCWSDYSHPCEPACNRPTGPDCETQSGLDCGIWYDCRIFPYNVNNWRPEFECERAAVMAAVLPVLRSKLDDGVFIWNYEGHANKYFLAHEEVWRDDRSNRHDVDFLANEGRPFIFLGFACHLAEFDREDEGVQGDCISEKMMNVQQVGLERPAGCVASFASSGYEFLGPNLVLNDLVLRAFFFPEQLENDPSGAGLPDDGDANAYVWTLGEAVTRARLEFQQRYLPGGSDFREAARRFVLLGDPALSPDFGAPQIEVSVNGTVVEDPGTDFFAPPDEYPGVVEVVMTATEGRGISTIRVVDSQLGAVDPAAYQVVTEQQTADGVPQVQTLTYDFQLRPGDAYSLTFEAVDGAGHAAQFVVRTDTRFEFVDGQAAIYPNPFTDRTRLVFRLPSRASSGKLLVYTVAGRRILERSLGGFAPNEQVEVEWDGHDEGGLPVANGTYFLRLELSGTSGRIEETFPVVLMR